MRNPFLHAILLTTLSNSAPAFCLHKAGCIETFFAKERFQTEHLADEGDRAKELTAVALTYLRVRFHFISEPAEGVRYALPNGRPIRLTTEQFDGLISIGMRLNKLAS